MARLEINEVCWYRDGQGNVHVASGASVLVKDLDGNTVTLYNARSGGSTIPNPTTTDANGRIDGPAATGCYIDEADVPALLYVTHAAGTYTQDFQPNTSVTTIETTYSGSDEGFGVDVWSLSPDPENEDDFGALINAVLEQGNDAEEVPSVRRLVFGQHVFPFTTPIDLVVSRGVVFQGVHGRGWYTGGAQDFVGAQLVWKGGASPVIEHTDGVAVSGDATFTSASAPWTEVGTLHCGQPITVEGAGPGGTDLVTRIKSRTSNGSIELIDAPSTSVNPATYQFTNWTRAINGVGSTGVQFRDMKIVYDDPDFDGILIDLRSYTTWSARGLIEHCMVGGRALDYATPANMCCRAYALVHLNGHGEHFEAEGSGFGGAKAAIRGQYGTNADDVKFTNCFFIACYEGAIVNPGRYWKFDRCGWSGMAMSGGPPMGPHFLTENPCQIDSTFAVDNCTMWDHETITGSDGAIEEGSNVLTLSHARLTTWTEDMFWKDRPIHVEGAGDDGYQRSSNTYFYNLHARIVRRIDATHLELDRVATHTVSGADWVTGDGGLFYQRPGADHAWYLTVRNLFSWFDPCPGFDLKGRGSLDIQHWYTNRSYRLDIVSAGPYIDLGVYENNVCDTRVWLEDCSFGSANTDEDHVDAIKNFAGHDLRRVRDTLYVPHVDVLGTTYHESVEGYYTRGCPTAVAHSGQSLDGGVGIMGNDTSGYIYCKTTGSGATAGAFLDLTFNRPWEAYGGLYRPTSIIGLYSIILTPMAVVNDTPNYERGTNSVAAGAYAVMNNDDPGTGWILAIANSISGAKDLGWSYRVTRVG